MASLRSISKIIRSGMSDYLREIGVQSIDSADSRQRGKAFSWFYMNEIAKYILSFDEDLIEEGLSADYRGDLNIDFVYNADGIFYIYQAKYKGSKNSLTRDEIAGFSKIHSRIIDKDYFEKYANSTVQDLLYDFNKKSKVHYVLLTNDMVADTLKEDFNKTTTDERERYKEYDIDFELIDLSQIKDNYKNASSIDRPIPDEIVLPIEKILDHFSEKKHWAYIDLSTILGEETKYLTYLTTIKGTVLQRLYKQYRGGRLFNYNIRGYLGSNTINKKMKETIEKNPTLFYLFNNGISAICTDINLEKTSKGHGLQIRAKNFQIINGAQTTCTIGTYKDSQKLKDVRVVLRITKTEDIKKEKGLNRQIITYNNSQTVIKASDFRSNDEIQAFLEKGLKKYKYKAKSPFKNLKYKPKRMKYKRSTDEIYLNMETLAKVLYVYKYEPTKIYANSRFLFDADSSSNGRYWDIFGEEGEECSFYAEDRLKQIAAISMLWLYINEKLKNLSKITKLSKGETLEYQSYLAKWHFLWAYGYIQRTLYADKMDTFINRILDGKAFKDSFVDIWFESIADKIQDQLDDEYIESKPNDENEETEIIPKGFNFKNWLRNSKSFEKLSRRFKRVKKVNFPLDCR